MMVAKCERNGSINTGDRRASYRDLENFPSNDRFREDCTELRTPAIGRPPPAVNRESPQSSTPISIGGSLFRFVDDLRVSEERLQLKARARECLLPPRLPIDDTNSANWPESICFKHGKRVDERAAAGDHILNKHE